MTQGVLLFAHDNEQVQYGLMAVWQARRISKWLNKPVSIVTDQKTVDALGTLSDVFDHVILTDSVSTQSKSYSGTQLTFNNIDRVLAWDLTPYDETLVIDTDILIQSDRLNIVWDNAEDMLVCVDSNDLFGRKFAGFDHLSNFGIKFYWATVFYFKKNDVTELFFKTCKRIKSNYVWYAHVYNITSKYLRNDHVWSIALHELGGKAGAQWASTIPCNLYYTLDRDSIVSMDENAVTMLSKDKLAQVKGSDLHVMNKFSLMDHVRKELAV